jgi:hypothetical protein
MIELDDYYGSSFSATVIDHQLDEGRYFLRLILRPPHTSADSVENSFQVVMPKGDELAVYQKFVELARGEANGVYTAKQVTDSLVALHIAYANSVYTPVVLTLLDAECDIRLNDHEKAYAFRRELIEKYPLSVRGWQMLGGILRSLPSNQERTEYLEKLRIPANNSNFGKLIQKKIQAEEAGR